MKNDSDVNKTSIVQTTNKTKQRGGIKNKTSDHLVNVFIQAHCDAPEIVTMTQPYTIT